MPLKFINLFIVYAHCTLEIISNFSFNWMTLNIIIIHYIITVNLK